jgi:hypothetical protein
MSPYQYGGNNPIKYIDVNGDSIRVGNQVWTPGATYKGNDKFTQAVFAALNSLFENVEKDGAGNVKTKEAEGNVILDFVGSTEHDVEIIHTDGNAMASESGNQILWNPEETIILNKTRGGGEISSTTLLAHEFGHSWLAKFSPKANAGHENADINNVLDDSEHEWILKNVENSFSRSRNEGIRKTYVGTVDYTPKNSKTRTKTDFRTYKPIKK